MRSIAEEKIEIKWNELFYYLFLFIMTVAKGTGLYEGMRLYQICLALAGICIVLKICSEKYSIQEIIAVGALILTGLVVYRTTGDQAAPIYIAMLVGMKNIPIKRVFFWEGCVWSACFLFRCALGMSGIYRGLVLVHEKLGLGPVIRWSFGYPHPNVLQITYAIVAALLLYNIKWKGKRLYALLVTLFFGNCFVFLYSISYTGFLLTTALLVVSAYFLLREKRCRMENILIQCILPACVLFAVGLPLAMETGNILNGLDEFMNKLFNTRFLASRVYLYEGAGLFGTDVSHIGFALDCSYVYLLMKGGILLFVLILAGYFVLIHRFLRQDRRRELAIVITFLIAGISEPFLFNTSFKNVTFFFLGELLFELLKGKKTENSGIWKRKIGFWDSNRKACLVKIKGLKKISEYVYIVCRRKQTAICLAGIIGASLAAICYLFIYQAPEGIYVTVGNTDCGRREEFFLSEREVKESDYLVYEYQGESVSMYLFDGNTVKLEILRDGVSCVAFGATGAVLIFLAGTAIGETKKKRRKVK